MTRAHNRTGAGFWSREIIEGIRQDAEAGLSASQIALKHGNVTRNSIVGVCHRNGIKLKGGNSRERKPRTYQPRIRIMTQALPNLIPDPPDVPMQESFNLTFSELRIGDCKYPSGNCAEDYRFCGLPALEFLPYCSFHSRLCFVPPQERRRERARV